MGIDTFGMTYSPYLMSRHFQGTMTLSSGLFRVSGTMYITVRDNKINMDSVLGKGVQKECLHIRHHEVRGEEQVLGVLDGNFNTIQIYIDNDAKGVLMVVKDSYANCMIPMLTPY